MKCTDVSRWLDERDLRELSAAETAGLEAHVRSCAECAAQYLAGEQAQAFRADVPPLPAALREYAERLRDACADDAPRRSTRRPVILGGLLLLGGAATMFAAAPWRDTGTVDRSSSI